MADKRWVVARNDWCARRCVKQVYLGRLDEERALFNHPSKAFRKIRGLPPAKQGEYEVFEVLFDRSKVIKQ